jgi:tetratricopeptide (TPR) repeat protein
VPTDDACLVVAVEGAATTGTDRARLATLARTVFASFRATAPAPEVRPALNFAAGWQLLGEKAFVASLARFETALALDPTLVRAHLGAGLAAQGAGDGYEDKVIAHYSQALAAQGVSDERPDRELSREMLVGVGIALATKKDYAAAERTLAEAATRYPEDGVVHYNFACVLALRGDPDTALTELAEAFARQPSLAEHARSDDDLLTLRERPAFRRLVRDADAAHRRDERPDDSD